MVRRGNRSGCSTHNPPSAVVVSAKFATRKDGNGRIVYVIQLIEAIVEFAAHAIAEVIDKMQGITTACRQMQGVFNEHVVAISTISRRCIGEHASPIGTNIFIATVIEHIAHLIAQLPIGFGAVVIGTNF